MHTMRLYLLVAVVILLFTCAVWAQSPAGTSSSLGPTYYLLRALLSLALVVALIYAIYFGLRRLSTHRLSGTSDDQLQLRLLHSRHLGGGRWIYAIRVADRVLIVGGGTEGLRTLAEMSADQYSQHSAHSASEEAPADA